MNENDLERLERYARERKESAIKSIKNLPEDVKFTFKEEHRHHKTLGQIYEALGLDMDQDPSFDKLRTKLEEESKNFLEFTAKELPYSFPTGKDWYWFLHLLFDLYTLSQNKDRTNLPEWIGIFSTWESYIDQMFGAMDPAKRGALIRYIERFMVLELNPLEFITYHKDYRDDDGIRYSYELPIREWILLPIIWPFGFNFASLEAFDEFIELFKANKLPQYPIIHSTGVTALDGIATAEGLCIPYGPVTFDTGVKTGAYYYEGREYKSSENVLTGRNGMPFVSAHNSRYASQSIATQKWFNEYEVSFIVDPKALERLSLTGHKVAITSNFLYEGDIDLGPYVPLQAMTHLYCPYSKLKEMRDWVSENAPHIIVMSLEAVEIMAHLQIKSGDILKDMAEHMNMSELDTLLYIRRISLNKDI